jgi:hypothetical protein
MQKNACRQLADKSALVLKILTSNNLLIFLLIFVIAIVFYLFNIGFSDLWSDEIYTKSMFNGSLPDFYAKLKNDLHPPLYYLGSISPQNFYNREKYFVRQISQPEIE